LGRFVDPLFKNPCFLSTPKFFIFLSGTKWESGLLQIHIYHKKILDDMKIVYGSYEIENGLFLAPMEDVSDYPFRMICKKLGADVMYSEFISS